MWGDNTKDENMEEEPVEKKSMWVKESIKTLKHPGTVIISPNEYYTKGLTEQDIYDYYERVKDNLLKLYEEYKLDCLLKIKIDNTLIVKRLKNEELLKSWNVINNGRTVEFHIVLPTQYSRIYWIDLDPKEKFPFETVYEIAEKIKNLCLKNISNTSDVVINYTGGRGMYVIGFLNKEQDVNKIKNTLKELIESNIIPEYPKTTLGFTKESDNMRIDLSTLHKLGSIRSPYSLNATTGLVSKELKSLDKEDYNINFFKKSFTFNLWILQATLLPQIIGEINTLNKDPEYINRIIDTLYVMSSFIKGLEGKSKEEIKKVYTQEWKEEMKSRINNIISTINSGRIPNSKDWELIFTYSDKFKDNINMQSLLEKVIKMKYAIERGDRERIDKPEFLTLIAKFLIRRPYEKTNLSKELIQKIQNKIGESSSASLDYLLSVAKGYRPEYQEYRKDWVTVVLEKNKRTGRDIDEDDLEDTISFIKLLNRSGEKLTDDEKKAIEQIFLKFPLYAIKVADELINLGVSLDKNTLIEEIAKNSGNSFEYAKLLIEKRKDIKEIPEIIIQGIAQNSISSYDFAKLLIEKGKDIKEIPEIILQGIAQDSVYSYYFAEFLIDQGKDIKEIPEIIIQGIAQSSRNSYYFADLLIDQGKDIKEIPEIILQGVAQSSDDSYYFAKFLIEQGKDVKEIHEGIIQSILRDKEYKEKYFDLLRQYNLPLPEEYEIKNENREEEPVEKKSMWVNSNKKQLTIRGIYNKGYKIYPLYSLAFVAKEAYDIAREHLNKDTVSKYMDMVKNIEDTKERNEAAFNLWITTEGYLPYEETISKIRNKIDTFSKYERITVSRLIEKFRNFLKQQFVNIGKA